MHIKTGLLNLKKNAALVDWKLLAFLVLFMDVKIAVKVVAIILIYLLQFDLKMGFTLKNSRLPLFYPIAIGIAVLNWLIYGGYRQLNYDVVFFTGIGFWLLCILAIHQVKLSVEKNTAEVIHKTILLFFLLNAMVSVVVLLNIIRETHTINPYRYQGQFQKYFIGTGDYIKGLTFDISTTNAVLNAFGVIYFLVRRNVLMVLICMAVTLLTGSNSINLMLVGVLVLLFIFKTTTDQKSIVVVCIMFLAVFMFKVSPQNDEYIYKTYYILRYHHFPVVKTVILHPIPVTLKPDSILSPDEKKDKIALLYLDTARTIWKTKHQILVSKVKLAIPVPSIHTPWFQNKPDTNAERLELIAFVKQHKAQLPQASLPDIKTTLPGKLIAMGQTLRFLQHQPLKILTGDGMGNFSSKLAFKATNLNVAGGFPSKYAYISSGFLINHLDVYLNFFSRDAGFHSLTNSPNSVYDQLLGEYGLIGLLAFAIFYIGYFIRQYKTLTYGLPLLILMAGVFMLDYWFEQLSVIVFFELLMLVNIKETQPKTLNNGN
jgi:hypothetical protein